MKLYSDVLCAEDGFEDIDNPTNTQIERVLSAVFDTVYLNPIHLQLDSDNISLCLHCDCNYGDILPLSVEVVEYCADMELVNRAPENEHDMLLRRKSFYRDSDKDAIIWKQVKSTTRADAIQIFRSFGADNSDWKLWFQFDFRSRLFSNNKTRFGLEFFDLTGATVRQNLERVYQQRLAHYQPNDYVFLGDRFRVAAEEETYLISAIYEHLRHVFEL